MKKWFFLLCICIANVHAAPFYQTPNPDAAYRWIEAYLEAKEIEQIAEENRFFVLSLATTFIAQVIKTHSEYVESFAQNFSCFSPLEKSIFVQAFSTMGIQDPRVQGTELCEITSIASLDHLEFKRGHDFDLMIVSYLATGDELFLRQPMAFLNSDPELLLFAYEWHNRLFLNEIIHPLIGQRTELPDEAEFSDILNSWPKEKLHQFALKIAAWHCLDLIQKEDPTASEKIFQLCKTNPMLDYPGTLIKLLGGYIRG